MNVTRSEPGAPHALTDFLRTNSARIIEDWKASVRTLSPTHGLSDTALLDHLPQVLEMIAEYVASDDDAPGAPPADRRPPQSHAVDRLSRGFDLDEVIREYALLRRVILDLWARYVDTHITVADLRKLDAAFDESIRQSSVRYARGRERMLVAIDRISEAAFGTTDLDTFLKKLLAATLELTESIDAAVVLLRVDGSERLRTRAAVGLDGDLSPDVTVRIGEGLAGRVAAERAPIFVRDASKDPLTSTSAVKAAGIHALYAVPLLHDDELVGVIEMASRTAFEFSDEDKLLFRLMTSRATSVIVQAALVQKEQAARLELEQANQRISEFAALQTASRDEAERALALIDALLAASPAGLAFIDRDLKYARINDALAKMNGVPAHEHIGRSIHEVLPAHAHELERLLRRVIDRGEQIKDLEVRVASKDDDGRGGQRTRTFLTNFFPVRVAGGDVLGVGGVIVDITERKATADAQRFIAEASQVLARSLDFETTLQTMAQLVVPALADWCSVDVVDGSSVRNVAAVHRDPMKTALVQELRTKYLPRAESQHGVAHVLRSGRPVRYDPMPDELIASETINDEHRAAVRAAGMASVMIVPLIAREKVLGAITFVLADTARHYSEQDLEVAQDLVARAALAADNALLYQNAEVAARMREDLIAVVSHDLKNPLNAISLSTLLVVRKLRKAGQLDDVGKHLDVIERASSRMSHLINELLTMAHIEAGRLTIERTSHAVGELVESVVSLHEPIAEARQLALKTELPPEIAAMTVNVDRERLQQVFSNLIGNALKYAPHGQEIVVSAAIVGDEVRFCVRDRGPGIQLADQAHIFDRYWSSERDARRGTGLGLYIAKAIVEAHGGGIGVKSKPGDGAEFWFTIPV